MYLCMLVCIYIHIYIYRCMYACMYIFVSISIRWFHSVRFIRKLFCAYTYMGFGTHRKFELFFLANSIVKNIQTHAYAFNYLCTHFLSPKPVHTRARARTHTHTHTHTHTSTHTQDMELEERLLEVEQVTYRMCNMYTYINAHKRKHTHTHTHTHTHARIHT